MSEDRRRWFFTAVLVCGGFLNGTSPARTEEARPLDVVFVLDQTQSMKVNDSELQMGQAVIHFIDEMRPEDAAGLVLFGSKAWVVQSLNRMQGAQREALKDFVSQIRYADAQSDIAAGIEQGFKELRSRGRTESDQVLIFVGDGTMDTGSPAQDEEKKGWLRERLLPEVRLRGIRIFSVAFTDQADSVLFRDMAEKTGGEFFRASSAPEIRSTFQQISIALQKPAKPIVANPPPVPAPTPVPVPTPPKPGSLSTWLIGGLIVLIIVGLMAVFWRSRHAPSDAMAPLPPAKLVDLKTGKPTPLDKPIIRIGRLPDNDLVIPVQTVSGHHATIKFRGGQFFLQDLKSTNETKVNEQKIKGEVLLRSGDILRFDEFGYTFMGPEPEEDATLIRKSILDPEGTMVRKGSSSELGIPPREKKF